MLFPIFSLLCLFSPKSGAHDQDRTDDLVLTKDVLYQLSYMGIVNNAHLILTPSNDKKTTPFVPISENQKAVTLPFTTE
jgi:hypothetical protein